MSSRQPSGTPWRNTDVEWNDWPVHAYLSENYRQLHACDVAVLKHHSNFYRQFAPDSLTRTLEFGAGPNLYPLMLAAAASQHIHAVDYSAPNIAYLKGQLHEGADEAWQPFYAKCREHNPALPLTLPQALSRVSVEFADVRDTPPGTYDLASMNFVAESISEDLTEVEALCHTFINSVVPGGRLVASFMENMGRYQLGDGSQWPGCPIDEAQVHDIFAPHTGNLVITRIGPDPELPDYGYTGMILLTASRRT